MENMVAPPAGIPASVWESMTADQKSAVMTALEAAKSRSKRKGPALTPPQAEWLEATKSDLRRLQVPADLPITRLTIWLAEGKVSVSSTVWASETAQTSVVRFLASRNLPIVGPHPTIGEKFHSQFKTWAAARQLPVPKSMK